MQSQGSKSYFINEVFYSLQGEGIRKGTPNLFVRFTGCNLKCAKEPGDKSPGGFDCDTEFASGVKHSCETLDALIFDVLNEAGAGLKQSRINNLTAVERGNAWMILTGGEPGLQVDLDFLHHFRGMGWKIAIETNGSILLPHTRPVDATETITSALDAFPIDWITVSPKVAEHAIRQPVAHEVKYVRGLGQGIPKPTCNALNYLISPAFDGVEVSQSVVNWCAKLVKENPLWTLSLQEHKLARQR